MTKRKAKSAADFVAELNADPEYVRRRSEEEDARVSREAEIQVITQPLLEELRAAGYPLATIDELLWRHAPLPEPVVRSLLHWLPQLSDTSVKEQVVRALGASAQPFDGRALVQQFEDCDSDAVRYAVANTLAASRATGVTDWILTAIARPESGTAREMLALAAARLAGEDANPVLLKLLEELPGHAALALAETGGEQELRALETKYLTSEGWVKQQIGRAVSVIRRRLSRGRETD